MGGRTRMTTQTPRREALDPSDVGFPVEEATPP